jgi:hypothetical protein
MASALSPHHEKSKAGSIMFWAFSAFLLVLCFLGLAGFYSLAAFFDVFLILAALISFFRVARGQRTAS